MKITPKQSALSLYEALEEKSAGQIKAVIKKFVELLARDNMLGASDKIIVQFVKIWHEKQGLVEAEAISANGLSQANIKLLENYIIKLAGAKTVSLNEKIDKNILGGVVIRYGDKILDASLKTQLEELKEKMVK
ncbi:MAG: ATP synthase F1 subunit delta [Parcubacteria group bacterium]|nr:ATP synthase F1 subunit delta [Parcubacteria group bacterium]